MASTPWSYLRGYETGTLATPAGPLPDPRNDDAPENKVVGGVVVGIGPSRISLILHLVESPVIAFVARTLASRERLSPSPGFLQTSGSVRHYSRTMYLPPE